MNTFPLSTGGHVSVFYIGTETEFVHTNASGEVTATVRKTGPDAAKTLTALRLAYELAR